MLCESLGTEGLDGGHEVERSEQEGDVGDLGELGRLNGLYTRFRPRRKEPDFTVSYRHPAGDVPGSRTWQDPNNDTTADTPLERDEAVTETVTVDAHDLFSQLTAQVYLGKRSPFSGLLFSIQEVSEGTIRVWRHWLARQCERRGWTDGESVVVHHEPPEPQQEGTGKARADSVLGPGVGGREDPRKDPMVLWINTSGESVGVRFRVRERKQRRDRAPVLFASEEEVAVSYAVEFEGTFEVALRSLLSFHLNVLLSPVLVEQ